MDENNLAELANLPAEELIERLGTLDADALTALGKIEKAGANRPGVGKAISAARKAAPKLPAETKQPAADTKAAPHARGPEGEASASPPAWQAPDYDGPLTIPQAAWRRHNVKPAGSVRTK